jgi:hypothetical protein
MVSYNNAADYSPVQYGVQVGGASGTLTSTLLTNGQLLVGSTAAAPVATTLTGGTGVSITNGAGSITISATEAGGVVWNAAPASTGMSPDNGYLTTGASIVTLTLPATAAQFSVIRVAGFGVGGWSIAQNAGQSIQFGSGPSTTVGVGGSLASTNQFDTVEMIAAVGGASTTWLVLSSVGNLSIT